MSIPTQFDIRQSDTRVLQDQLNATAIVKMDSTLFSINNELKAPARLIAQATPSLIVTIDPGLVVNPNTSKNRVLPLINGSVVNFTGGTLTFPSTSGTIVNSNGSNASITIGASQFVAVLVLLNSMGQLLLLVGAAASSLGAVVVPSSASNLPLGYIIVQSNGSSAIQNITNAMIYQFVDRVNIGESLSGSVIASGFQPFIDNFTNIIAPTVTTGTPVSGTFYSSIINRASLSDFSQDLKARFAIDRLMVQGLYNILSESGPNGELVFGAMNDDLQQIRFVGNWATQVVSNTDGTLNRTINTNDFVEVVFYGTGLNLLSANQATGQDIRASVDGGAEGSNIIPSSASNIIDNRNYAPNIIVPVVKSLTAGIHTVKLRTNSTNSFAVSGFEILNEQSSGLVTVNPNLAYSASQQISLASQAMQSYNSGFTSGTLGTTGGSVLMYLTAIGTIATAVNPVAASPSYLTSASHASERLIRNYNWQEFSCGRSNDFSAAALNGSDILAGILSDDTTVLVGHTIGYSIRSDSDISYSALALSSTSDYFTFTFVGTGLDILAESNGSGTMNTYQVNIDDVNVGNLPTTSAGAGGFLIKIASGLPYGSHTVRIIKNSTGNNTWYFVNFMAYGPSLPALPAGAIQLANYNILANYAAVTGTDSQSSDQKPTGIIHKLSPREWQYVGTGWAGTINNNTPAYYSILTTVNGDTASYTFFGTGCSLHSISNDVVFSFNISIDGTLNSSGVARANAVNSGSGLYTTTTTTTELPVRIEFTGLTLGLHTITMTKVSGTAMRVAAIDIITPIHSYKPTVRTDIQNTLSIGSNGIQDNRQFTPVKNSLPVNKFLGQAFGIVTSPTTTSSTAILVPDMVQTALCSAPTNLRISYSIDCTIGTGGNTATFRLMVDGNFVGTNKSYGNNNGGYDGVVSDEIIVPVSAGAHQVSLTWFTTGGTITSPGGARTLLVEEL